MGSAGIAVLGPLTVDGGRVAVGRRDRVVLAALVVHLGEVVTAELLADALWGERPPASWNKVVAGCVMRLRRALGAAAIETTAHGYRLAVPAEEVDAYRFERLVDRGRSLLALGEHERAAYALGEALGLWRSRALVDLGDWEQGRIEAARLDELHLDAAEARIDARLRIGQHREVLGDAQTCVAEAPLRERRWGLLALAQYQGGRQADALRTLQQARAVLADELGLDPGPDLVALEQAILCQDPALSVNPAHTEPRASCPYLGLVSYDVRDSETFFGRDAEVTDCLRRVASTGVLAVVGPSGCGKSSLVRAGVAAALGRDGRRVVVVTPGARPLDVLGSISMTGDVVLVVDQCEEVVSLCDDVATQATFFAALVEMAERHTVIVAVRADRLGDVSVHVGFARLVERGLYLLGGMDDANLRSAIEGPAHQAGLLLEPGLVDLLARDVEAEPGALPLLSHALRQTWERREGRTLTVAGYGETGGIRGAVAQSAEAVYEQAPPDQRPLLRDLLLRLVAPSPDGEAIRGRVPRRSLATDADHERLIEQLVTARLVTSDDGVVELAHEALARAWPRLRGWLDDDVEGQRILRHLAAAADAWDIMGRPDSELYRGARLSHVIDWRDDTTADLTPTERDFLDTAERLAAAERHAVEDQARRQRGSRRRLRALMAGVAVMLTVALVTGVLALRQRKRADSAAIAADARRIATQSRDSDDIGRSLLLAVEAVRLDDSPDTRAGLLAALSRSPALVGSVTTGQRFVGWNASPAVDVSPDGAVVVAGSEFRDARTLAVTGSVSVLPSRVEYRHDGKQLVVATMDVDGSAQKTFAQMPVHLVDAKTFKDEAVQLGGLPEGPFESWDLDYSADGRFLAVTIDIYDNGGFESTAMVWNTARLEQPVQQIELGQAWAIALSPDGRLLYAGTHEPALAVYDVATGQRVRSISMSSNLILGTSAASNAFDGLEVSPDGSTLAVFDANEIVLLDAATLAERRRLRGHSELVQSIQFSHDGTLLASGSDDRAIVLWDVATGVQLERLSGHMASVRSVSFSPDDATLYSQSFDHNLRVWDLRGGRRFITRLVPIERDGDFSEFAVPSPDGAAVAYFSRTVSSEWGDTIQFRDLGTGRLGKPVATQHGNSGAAWRPPDWDHMATGDADGFVHVWDWRRGEIVRERKVASGLIGTVAYTQDGGRIVVVERTGTVLQIDADTLEQVGPKVDVGSEVVDVDTNGDRAVAILRGGTYAWVDLVDGRVLGQADLGLEPAFADISADGRRLAVGATTGEVGLIDLESGEWVRPPTVGHNGFVLRVAYSPDGATLASAGHDGQVSLWDSRTGAHLVTVVPGASDAWAAIDFLSDGHTVIVATRDGAVHAWDIRLEHWIEFACSVAGRNLTRDEWSAALGAYRYRETCPTA